jgi:hypothetical protein
MYYGMFTTINGGLNTRQLLGETFCDAEKDAQIMTNDPHSDLVWILNGETLKELGRSIRELQGVM